MVRLWNSNLDGAKYDESLPEVAREERGRLKGKIEGKERARNGCPRCERKRVDLELWTTRQMSSGI